MRQSGSAEALWSVRRRFTVVRAVELAMPPSWLMAAASLAMTEPSAKRRLVFSSTVFAESAPSEAEMSAKTAPGPTAAS